MLKSGSWFVALFLYGVSFVPAQPGSEPKSSARTLIVTVSVDWEGTSLDERDLKAFSAFRDRFPSVPLTNFLNAVYYTRSADPRRVTQKIRRVLRRGDELGIHIHAWRSLLEKAKVKFKSEPRFWGDWIKPARPEGDEGYTVELSAFSAAEVRQVAVTSRNILRAQGFEISRSFRCGAWLASPEVLHGVRQASFTIDSSATDRSWHEDEIGHHPLFKRLGELWPKVTQHTQPYEIRTPAGALLEMPDTGALADYVTADEMSEHLRAVLERIRPGQKRYAHLGFHQDGCRRYLQRLVECLETWTKRAEVRFLTLERAAEFFRADQRKAVSSGDR